jgi:hypothetical protein
MEERFSYPTGHINILNIITQPTDDIPAGMLQNREHRPAGSKEKYQQRPDIPKTSVKSILQASNELLGLLFQ